MNYKRISDNNNSIFSVKKLFTFLILICIFNISAFSQNKYSIDYFGIVAAGVDDNMSKMTSDLYYTQLCEINGYTVNDKRIGIRMASVPQSSDFEDGKISLYAVISKKENTSKWISTINIYDSSRKAVFSEAKEYDSFYKILMEPKASLQETISTLLSGSGTVAQAPGGSASPSKPAAKIQSTEFLSGTWGGEETIDKIVIMRGGRGFVIFKNGSSMNITVEIQTEGSSQNIVITQNGKANASFFPELPREVALKEAVNAKPIKWIFNINDDDTLSGTKSTLILSDGVAANGTLDVVWKRKS